MCMRYEAQSDAKNPHEVPLHAAIAMVGEWFPPGPIETALPQVVIATHLRRAGDDGRPRHASTSRLFLLPDQQRRLRAQHHFRSAKVLIKNQELKRIAALRAANQRQGSLCSCRLAHLPLRPHKRECTLEQKPVHMRVIRHQHTQLRR